MEEPKKKRSRMEKYHSEQETSPADSIDLSFDVNPFAKKEVVAPKRTKTYEHIVIAKTPTNTESSTSTKKELYDIEDAFKILRKEHHSYDKDTKLEIMNDLLSDNLVEYNNISPIQRNAKTKEIVISEEDLIKMLEKKKEAKEKKVLKKPAILKKEEVTKVEEEPKLHFDNPIVDKEPLVYKQLDATEPVSKVEEPVKVTKPKVKKEKVKREKLKIEKDNESEETSNKSVFNTNVILGIVLAVLFLYLVYLIIQFFG